MADGDGLGFGCGRCVEEKIQTQPGEFCVEQLRTAADGGGVLGRLQVPEHSSGACPLELENGLTATFMKNRMQASINNYSKMLHIRQFR